MSKLLLGLFFPASSQSEDVFLLAFTLPTAPGSRGRALDSESLVLSSGPLEAKGVGDKDNHSTPSLGKVPLQPEEPGWGQGKLHYETARVLQLSVSWISKQLSNCHRLHLPLP